MYCVTVILLIHQRRPFLRLPAFHLCSLNSNYPHHKINYLHSIYHSAVVAHSCKATARHITTLKVLYFYPFVHKLTVASINRYCYVLGSSFFLWLHVYILEWQEVWVVPGYTLWLRKRPHHFRTRTRHPDWLSRASQHARCATQNTIDINQL